MNVIKPYNMASELAMPKNKSLLLKACEKMEEKLAQQRTQVYDDIHSEASSIATNVTYLTLCRNELAQKAAREAISVARSYNSFYRHQGKKLIRELDHMLSDYDTTIAKVAGAVEQVLDYADGFTDIFVERAYPYYNKLYNSIFVTLVQYDLPEAEIISHFEAAGILLQYVSARLDVEISTFKLRSTTISSLGYLNLSRTSKKVADILRYLNKNYFPEGQDLNLNEQPAICQAVEQLFDHISNLENVRNCMTDYEKKLHDEDITEA